jgi:hypothetical protein
MGNQSCKIDNGTGEKGFWFWSECKVKECDSGYEETDGKCTNIVVLSGPCTPNPLVANAVTYVYNSDSVCVVEKCEAGYVLQDGKCDRPGPKDIPGLTGWYKDSISTDKKRWLDNSGNKNDWIIPATELAEFTLTDGTVSSNYKTLIGPNNKDGKNIATLKTSNLTPNAFTLFHVTKYVKDLASNQILDIDVYVDKDGVMDTNKYKGYHLNSGMYAGIRMCSIINESYNPIVQVGSACYEPGGESTNYPPGEKPFIQITSQHLVHRVNSKNYPYVTLISGKSDAEAIALTVEPTKTQLKDVNSAIKLYAPFEMKELLIYNRKLTADEIDTVEKYLNDKYQLY